MGGLLEVDDLDGVMPLLNSSDYREVVDEGFDAVSSVGDGRARRRRPDGRLRPPAGRVHEARRVRVWRLSLRAARNGFVNGTTSIYQVRARKPE